MAAPVAVVDDVGADRAVLVLGAWSALMPLVATSVMGLTPGEYGVVLSALGVGGLLGAVAVTSTNRLLGRRWALLAEFSGGQAAFGVFAVVVLATVVPFLRTVTPQVLDGVEQAKQRQLAEEEHA